MNLLYISYDGALDPLGSSQILPYLTELSKMGIHFTLLSFEKKENLKKKDKLRLTEKKCFENNIRWERLIYHKSPSVIATLFDVVCAVFKSLIIILRDKIKIIHARSFVGAVPALYLAKIFNLKFIFDMRGFWPEERIEGGIWHSKGLIYIIAKWHEKRFFLNADRIVCLTEKAKEIIKELPYLKGRRLSIDVIPTCVDIAKFTIREKDEDLTTRLNCGNRFVLVYFGSLGTWYMLDEMIAFFKAIKRLRPESFFMLLTPDKDFAKEKMREFEVKPGDFYVDFVERSQIPKWLAIASFSISFIKPTYSKKSSCPTKFGESLSCGVPVVINPGIGDTEKIVKDYNLGVVVEDFHEGEYTKAVNQLFKMLENGDKLKRHCKKVAEDIFSLRSGVDNYLKIYEDIKYE